MTVIKFKYNENWRNVFREIVEKIIRRKIANEYEYIDNVDYKRLSNIITKIYAKPIHKQSSLYKKKIDLDDVLKKLINKHNYIRISRI